MPDYVVLAATISFSVLLGGNLVAGLRGRPFASRHQMRIYNTWFRLGIAGFLVLPIAAIWESVQPDLHSFERGLLAFVALVSAGIAALLPAVRRSQLDRSLLERIEDDFQGTGMLLFRPGEDRSRVPGDRLPGGDAPTRGDVDRA